MQRAECSAVHRGCIAAIVALVLIALAMPGADAHKGMVSPFTYNEHVFPILRDRCGSCHYDGGPTPMSLLSYQDAQPWAEAIREQLVSEAMPPWYADPAGPAVRGGHTISPRELDILIMWAGGGTPQGDVTKTPAPAIHPRQWKLGEPDLTLTMNAAQVLAGRRHRRDSRIRARHRPDADDMGERASICSPGVRRWFAMRSCRRRMAGCSRSGVRATTPMLAPAWRRLSRSPRGRSFA